MKKLIIDLDDTITEKGFIRMVNEFLGTNYNQEDAGTYYVNDLIPKERMNEWVEFFEQRNVYDYANIIEGAKETLKKLNEKYDVYIVTAFVFRDKPEISGKIAFDKFNFIIKAFPFLNMRNIVLINNKDMLEADIRIDDSLKKLNGKAEKKLLFTAYHNKNITDEELKNAGVIRVNTWQDIEKELL